MRRFKKVLRLDGQDYSLCPTRCRRVGCYAHSQAARLCLAASITFNHNGSRRVDHFAANRARKDRHAEVATTHESDVGRAALIFTHDIKPIGARDPLRSPHVFCRPDP